VTNLSQHLLQPPTPLLQSLNIPFRRSPPLCILNISTFISPLLTIRAFSIRFRVHRSFTSYLFTSTDIACSLLVSLSYSRYPSSITRLHLAIAKLRGLTCILLLFASASASASNSDCISADVFVAGTCLPPLPDLLGGVRPAEFDSGLIGMMYIESYRVIKDRDRYSQSGMNSSPAAKYRL
jgi:hypothetical protein